MKPSLAAVALAEELESLGFSAFVMKTHAHQATPCIWVASGPVGRRHSTQLIYTAPDDEGRLWFWTEDLEPIAPADEVYVAADIIAATMAVQRARMQRVQAV